MSFLFVIGGTAQAGPNGNVICTGSKVDRIFSVHMELVLDHAMTSVKANAMKVVLKRDLSQADEHDLTLYKYQYGEANRAEQWTFPSELVRIDDTVAGPLAVIERFPFERTQVEDVEDIDGDGAPVQIVTLRASHFNHMNGLTAQLVVPEPVIVPGFGNGESLIRSTAI